LSRWAQSAPRPPIQAILRSNGVLLGRLPQAIQGWSEITSLHADKFGQPTPGSRVFLCTRQVINGRKHALKPTHADVPPPEK
jgi:hypothetical protein